MRCLPCSIEAQFGFLALFTYFLKEHSVVNKMIRKYFSTEKYSSSSFLNYLSRIISFLLVWKQSLESSFATQFRQIFKDSSMGAELEGGKKTSCATPKPDIFRFWISFVTFHRSYGKTKVLQIRGREGWSQTYLCHFLHRGERNFLGREWSHFRTQACIMNVYFIKWANEWMPFNSESAWKSCPLC